MRYQVISAGKIERAPEGLGKASAYVVYNNYRDHIIFCSPENYRCKVILALPQTLKLFFLADRVFQRLKPARPRSNTTASPTKA